MSSDRDKILVLSSFFKISLSCTQVLTLSNTTHIQRTTGALWRELVQAVVSSDRDKILDVAFNLNDLLASFDEENAGIDDVTSEGAILYKHASDDDDDHVDPSRVDNIALKALRLNNVPHLCVYSMSLQRSSVLQVQVIIPVLIYNYIIGGISCYNLHYLFW